MFYAILVAASLIFWLVAIDRPVLLIKFKSGQVVKQKGHLPATFRHNVIEIAKQNPFDGEFKVYQQRSGAKLVFSKHTPKPVQQRIRNVFPHQSFRSKGKKKIS
ncbi:DUF3634 family protein [Vibrio pectenicida]|uniref:DUF3634 family protein n=1 Tax=Vibrio pectenicida TaxID=62763 RepID=A0A427U354_9VIBR|nr:DUF3634 family protein [Vibrio pectenicida]RSD31055.1 DUF3634 family protein [Vibrio pectenicida]